VYDEESEIWWFSVIDIVHCHQLKMTATDGKHGEECEGVLP